jgi:hypothetical protein
MFCPSCGKEIPEQSSFCMGCGKAIHVVAQPGAPPPAMSLAVGPTSETKTLFRPLTWILLAILVLVGWYAVNRNSANGASRGPASSLLRPFSKPLLSGSVGVSPMQVQYWKFEIAPTMTNAHVTGSFHATGGLGNDIEAIVAEWGECENWINGHHGQALYVSGKVTNGSMDVPINQAGTYCLAFSNKMALLSGKTVSGSVELQYLLP